LRGTAPAPVIVAVGDDHRSRPDDEAQHVEAMAPPERVGGRREKRRQVRGIADDRHRHQTAAHDERRPMLGNQRVERRARVAHQSAHRPQRGSDPARPGTLVSHAPILTRRGSDRGNEG
jgi:hypothetical protein